VAVPEHVAYLEVFKGNQIVSYEGI
jgi:hypothetical protein